MFIRPCGPSAERSPSTKRRRTASRPRKAGHQGAPGERRGSGPGTWARADAVGRRRRGVEAEGSPRPQGAERPGGPGGRGELEAVPCLARAGSAPRRLPRAPPAASLWLSPHPSAESCPLPRSSASPGVTLRRPVNTQELHTALPTPTSPAYRNCLRAPTKSQSSTSPRKPSSKAAERHPVPLSSPHTPSSRSRLRPSGA